MKVRYALAAAATVVSFGASAQTMKPGLWEVTNKMQGGAGGEMAKAQAQMQREMANMPPEQKKMMQEMMAKHGVQMGAGGGTSIRTCMTKEMIDRNEMPSQQGDCRMTKQSRSGNTTKFAMTCSNPPATAEGQVTVQSPEAYSMKMVMHTKVDGKSETVNMEASGKWLSADCGNVKPPAMPASAPRK